jgi:hypothetical protein
MNLLILLIALSVLCFVLGTADLIVTAIIRYQENKRFASQRALILKL